MVGPESWQTSEIHLPRSLCMGLLTPSSRTRKDAVEFLVLVVYSVIGPNERDLSDWSIWNGLKIRRPSERLKTN